MKDLDENYDIVDFKQSVTIRKRYHAQEMVII
jgi:hypothetical protein